MTKYIILPLISLLFIGCGVVRVESDYDKNANFSEYKTFNFHEKGLEKLKLNDLDKKRLIQALDTQLTAKGLTKTASNPDLMVNILTSSKEKIDIDNNMFGGWGWFNPWWGWGPTTSVREYTSGTIIIDIVDNKKNLLVWQGVGDGLNVSNISRKEERIPKAVEQILKKFPPQR